MGQRRIGASIRWLVAVLLLALVAAACGGNNDDGGGEAATPEAMVSPPKAEAESEPAPADPEPDGPVSTPAEEPAPTEGPAAVEAPEATQEPTPEPIVLTDSFRGVTSEAILIGHVHVDFERLRTDFGLDLPYGSFGPPFLALVDWYNEQGGVLGRRLEAISEAYWPVGSAGAEELCLKLTEDVEVFAVLGGFTGSGSAGVNTCITELHETILVGGLPSQSEADAAGGRWVIAPTSLDRRNAAFVSVLEQTGRIDELGPIMVIAITGAPPGLVDSVVEQLQAAGAEVPVVAKAAYTGDTIATQEEMDVFVERGRVEGVEAIMLIGESPTRDAQLFANAPDMVYLVPNGDRIGTWEQEQPEGLSPETVVLTARTFLDYPVDDPRIQQCIEVVEAATGVEIVPPDQQAEGDPDYWPGMFNACRDLAIFVQIAEAAGPDLTNESWVEALGRVPDLSVPGYDFVSIRPGKIDANDQQYLMEYDYDSKTFVELAGPLDVG